MCVTKNVMVQQRLGWFGAYPDLAETVDTAAMSIIAAKQPITPNIPIARGWITRLMTSRNKICDRDHFEFCLHFEFYFFPFSVCLQAKHDLFYAEGTLWYRFLDKKWTLHSFYVIIWKKTKKKKKKKKKKLQHNNAFVRPVCIVNVVFVVGGLNIPFSDFYNVYTRKEKKDHKEKETKFKGVWSGSTLFSEYLCGSWD